jgi:excisionase family DNA binding protein
MDADDDREHARLGARLRPPSLARFLTRKEAAAELQISLATLDRVIASGKLKAKKHGHAMVVMRREIERRG